MPFGLVVAMALVLSGLYSRAAAADSGPARSGTLNVLEDPGNPDGRRLTIHFVVVPATSGHALPDPIVPLMGGPGEDAISATSLYTGQFAPLLVDHDLLLVDQRGTGTSAPLRCQLYAPATAADSLQHFLPVAAVEHCRQKLESGADLRKYTFPYFANDLEQIRRALGYESLNLFAGSYGTRAAQAYIRQYPQSVRTAYLGSVIPIDSGGPLDFAKTEQTTLEHMFAHCAADRACNAAFPRLQAELRELVTRLDAGTVRVHTPRSESIVTLSRGRVIEWFRSKLYRPRDTAELPWIIHQASTGNWDPVVDGIIGDARNLDEDISLGLFFSITCSEDIPFVREQDVAAQTRGTFLGDYRLREQQAACRTWPKATLPQGYRDPVTSTVPTLFVTGDQDGGSPLWFTDRVAPGFNSHVTVVTHGQGHTEWNECVARLYAQLVQSGSVQNLDPRTCPAIPLPPFRTSSRETQGHS